MVSSLEIPSRALDRQRCMLEWVGRSKRDHVAGEQDLERLVSLWCRGNKINDINPAEKVMPELYHRFLQETSFKPACRTISSSRDSTAASSSLDLSGSNTSHPRTSTRHRHNLLVDDPIKAAILELEASPIS